MAGSKKKASSGKKKKRPSSSSKRTGANRKTAADTSSSASSSDAEGEPGGAKQPNPNAAVEGSTSAQDKVSSELDLSVLETVAERLHISRPSNDAKRIFSSNSVPRGGTATLGITYPPLLINTVDLCLSVCSLLAETQQDVAMDIEGVNLGRDGSICILQVACREPLEVTIAEKQVHKTNIFLFDICVLGKEGFEGGGLRHFLQDTTHLLKLFYDLRKDCDALFHIFQTKVCNVFDIQVLAFFRFCLSREQYLKMYNLPDRGPQGSGKPHHFLFCTHF